MSRSRRSDPRATLLTPALLRGWPLPEPDGGGSKEERGRALVVGGSPEMPGAVLLAAEGALRAGAGKLRIATGESSAGRIAAALPEGRVFTLPEAPHGAIRASCAEKLAERVNGVDAALVGPGMLDEDEVAQLLGALLPRARVPLVLDAAALAGARAHRDALRAHGNGILTPHAGEMAHLLGIDKDAVDADPLAVARRAAANFNAVFALKGATTFIVAPDGEAYCNTAGNVGLATSGSGDTLAGIVVGLLARGAPPLQAAVWGVYLHARAGDRLARRLGRLGYLARELLPEIPRVLRELERKDG